MRREWILRIWRECVALTKGVAELELNGGRYYGLLDPNAFVPARPWNVVLHLAIDHIYSTAFWEQYVRTPCFQIQAKVAYANTFLDGRCGWTASLCNWMRAPRTYYYL